MPPEGNSEIVLYIFLYAAAAAGYLLGSLNFAVIWSGLLYKDDIRKHGSGNAGTTNMLRTYGKKAALLTLIGDLLKGIVAAVSVGLLFKVCGQTYIKGASAAGFAAILGHNWPVFFKFKGGKGVLTSFAVVLAVMPFQGLMCLALFAIIVSITKYVSLGSVLSAAALPVFTVFRVCHGNVSELSDCVFLMVFACAAAVLVIVRHRENIKRLMSGTEHKLSFKKN